MKALAGFVALLLLVSGCASRNEKVPAAPSDHSLITRMETSLARELLDSSYSRLRAASPALNIQLGGTGSRQDSHEDHRQFTALIVELAERISAAVDERRIPDRLRRDLEHLQYHASLMQHQQQLDSIVRLSATEMPPLDQLRLLVNFLPIDSDSAIARLIQEIESIPSQTAQWTEWADQASLRMTGPAAILARCQSSSDEAEDLVMRATGRMAQSRRTHNTISQLRAAIRSAITRSCSHVIELVQNRQPAADQETSDRYAHALITYTSLPLTADVIHERATTFLSSLAATTADDRQPPDIQALLDEASTAILQIEPALSELTSIAPSMNLDVTATEANNSPSPGSYERGSNVGTCSLSPLWTHQFGVQETTFRYCLPGAHLVVATRYSLLSPVPAFAEGWALYALTILDRHWTDQVKVDRHLALATVRAAVDTGIHGRSWHRRQAKAFIQQHLSLTSPKADAIIQQTIDHPGRGAAAFAGLEAFQQLEKTARTTLGESFDWSAFIDLMLDEGERPFPVVERRLAEYLDSFTAGPSD